jgi:hypothetical protein
VLKSLLKQLPMLAPELAGLIRNIDTGVIVVVSGVEVRYIVSGWKLLSALTFSSSHLLPQTNTRTIC